VMAHPDPLELDRFADGDLGSRRARKVALHLEGCTECSCAVERIRATGGALRSAFDEALAEGPLDGFADRVMERLSVPPEAPLPWAARASAWLGEFFKHRKRVWAPSLALATSAAVALVLVVAFRTAPTPMDRSPAGSSIVSVSFGSTVNGAVFEMEDKDGSTTAVIWVDDAKTVAGDNVKAFRESESRTKEAVAAQSGKSAKTEYRIASSRPCTGKDSDGLGAKYA